MLGRDGLLIDGRTAPDLDAEHLAAITPGIAAAAEAVGQAAGRGALVTSIIEFERGMAIVSSLSTDAMLLVLVHPSANVGSLLFDLRRHRANIASIV